MGESDECEVHNEAERQLHTQNNPMPTMQAQVQRVHLAERKEQHKENQPWQDRAECQKPLVTEGTYEHREPKRVGVKETFHWSLSVSRWNNGKQSRP